MKTKDKIIGAGVGLAAIAAAAAYFLMGKRGEENRAAVAEWGKKLTELLSAELAEIQRTGKDGPSKLT